MTATAVALPKCPVRGKKSFINEADAVEFEERTRAEYNNLRQFAYACEDCNAWHLTTSPPGNNSIAQVKYEPGVSRKKGLDREMVVKHRADGWSVQQIADEYNVTTAAVKYHMAKAEGKITTKTNRSQPQLITWEQHRERRLELEADLMKKMQQHREIESKAEQEIDRVKRIEDRLFEDRQLKIEYGPDGQIILRKYDRKFDMTRDEVQKLLDEVRETPDRGRLPAEKEAS